MFYVCGKWTERKNQIFYCSTLFIISNENNNPDNQNKKRKDKKNTKYPTKPKIYSRKRKPLSNKYNINMTHFGFEIHTKYKMPNLHCDNENGFWTEMVFLVVSTGWKPLQLQSHSKCHASDNNALCKYWAVLHRTFTHDKAKIDKTGEIQTWNAIIRPPLFPARCCLCQKKRKEKNIFQLTFENYCYHFCNSLCFCFQFPINKHLIEAFSYIDFLLFIS